MPADSRAKGSPLEQSTQVGSSRGRPTPIVIGTWTVIIIAIVGLVAAVLLVRAAPSMLTILLGGATLALLLSFPVRAFARFMPRGIALLLSLLLLVGLLIVALVVLVPLLMEQLSMLITALPDLAVRTDAFLRTLLRRLAQSNIISQDPASVMTDLGQALAERVQVLARAALSGIVGGITSTVNLAIQIFGIAFVAVYLLLDIRTIKAGYVRLAPHRYRRDAWNLWEAFAQSLSQYLGGLIVIMALQGIVSGIALWLLGVPYAVLLGLWVSVTAIIPYLGAWLGAVPALIVALFISPTTALVTGVLFLAIQQLEGNVLTPRIQGQAIRVHPILVFLAVTAGGELVGLVGVIFAVPVLAIARVLFDFLRVRLHLRGTARSTATVSVSPRRSKVYDIDPHTNVIEPAVEQ